MSFVRKIKKNGKTYLSEVENRWVNGKCVQRHIRYIGKEVDNERKLTGSISDIEVDHVKLYGPLLVLNELAKEIDLSKQLGRYGEEILSLVYAHCLDYQSISQMESWFERTDLNVLLDIDGLTEKRLLNALDSLEEKDLEILQHQIYETVKEKYKIKSRGILYDVTNTYLYGKRCSLGRLGHDKEGVKGRPLIQIGLGVTQDEGIPIFHKVFQGNIHDARTLQDLITCFRRYKIKTGLIIYDRGITSAKNLEEVEALRWHTLCGLPIKDYLKPTLRPLMAEGDLICLQNRVTLSGSIFYVKTTPYAIGKSKGILALCFNPQQQKDLRESRYDEILNAQKLLKENKEIKRGLGKYFYKNGTLNQGKIDEAGEFDGYSCLFSTKAISKEKMISLYFDKDLVEKAFRSIKGVVRLQPIRHWLYNRVIAHIFICYLSYLLLALLKCRLKIWGMTSEHALKELQSMYKVYMRDSKKGFHVSRVVTLSRVQEKILRSINPKLLKPSV